MTILRRIFGDEPKPVKRNRLRVRAEVSPSPAVIVTIVDKWIGVLEREHLKSKKEVEAFVSELLEASQLVFED